MIQRLKRQQTALVKDSVSLLAPGGLLVYSVCTVEQEETLEVMEVVLSDCRSLELMDAKEFLPDSARGLITEDGLLRIFPGSFDMDGFFAAVLKKR